MKTEKDWSEFNKIERILITYHQFKHGIAPTMNNFPANSKKTFERDCNVLRKIGVEIKYSKTLKGYTSNLTAESEVRDLSVPETDNKAEERFLWRLIRLIDAMNSLDGYVSDWYKECYPDVTPRTRQRDLETLRNIGYNFTFKGQEFEEMWCDGKWSVDIPVQFL